VHWSPRCGFCDLIAPDLAKLQADFQKQNAQLLLVSFDDAESNRKLAEEHGLECPILLLGKSQSLDAFRNQGTPVAYLLDEQGRVAEPLAVGAEQVPALAREVAAGGAKKKRRRLSTERDLSESRIERNGLKPGTPAPAFELPDLHGNTVSLEAYRGRRILLLFSDPNCGPCDQLAPDLVRLHRQRGKNGLALVMVGRGDLEENRRKAEAHGFKFPVALQKRWEVSKAYGIFATPVAFLIDEAGVIARDVARGTDAILALVHEGLAAEKEKHNGQTI